MVVGMLQILSLLFLLCKGGQSVQIDDGVCTEAQLTQVSQQNLLRVQNWAQVIKNEIQTALLMMTRQFEENFITPWAQAPSYASLQSNGTHMYWYDKGRTFEFLMSDRGFWNPSTDQFIEAVTRLSDVCSQLWPDVSKRPLFCNDTTPYNDDIGRFGYAQAIGMMKICFDVVPASEILKSCWWSSNIGYGLSYIPVLEEAVVDLYSSDIQTAVAISYYPDSFMLIADPENSPDRTGRFTLPYLDPGQIGVWIFSYCQPLYLGDVWIGNVGSDIQLLNQDDLQLPKPTNTSYWCILLSGGEIIKAATEFHDYWSGAPGTILPNLFSSPMSNFSDIRNDLHNITEGVVNKSYITTVDGAKWVLSYIQDGETGFIPMIIVLLDDLDVGNITMNATIQNADPLLAGETLQLSFDIVSNSKFETRTVFSENADWILDIPDVITPAFGRATATVTYSVGSTKAAGTYLELITASTNDVTNGACFNEKKTISAVLYVTEGNTGVPPVVSAIVYIICGFGMTVCMTLMALTLKYSDRLHIASIGVPYVLINLFGAFLVCLSPILVAPESRTCFAGLCLFTFGFCFFFSSIIAKSYRLFRIKRGAEKLEVNEVTNLELAIGICVLVALQAIILGVWGGISLPYSEEIRTSTVNSEIYERCSWGEHEGAFLITECIFLVSLLVISLLLSRYSRDFFASSKKVSVIVEADEIFFAVYNFTVCVVLVGILFVVLDDVQVAWILILAIGLVSGVCLSIGALYAQRFYKVLFKDDPVTTSSSASRSRTKDNKSGGPHSKTSSISTTPSVNATGEK